MELFEYIRHREHEKITLYDFKSNKDIKFQALTPLLYHLNSLSTSTQSEIELSITEILMIHYFPKNDYEINKFLNLSSYDPLFVLTHIKKIIDNTRSEQLLQEIVIFCIKHNFMPSLNYLVETKNCKKFCIKVLKNVLDAKELKNILKIVDIVHDDIACKYILRDFLIKNDIESIKIMKENFPIKNYEIFEIAYKNFNGCEYYKLSEFANYMGLYEIENIFNNLENEKTKICAVS